METIFYHSLRHQSIAASGSSFFFNWNVFFSQTSIPASENKFFVYWKQYFLIPSFFLLMENNTEIWGKSNFKDEPYSCTWTPIFFNFIQIFFNAEVVVPYNESVFLNILYTTSANELSACGNSIILVRAILLLLEIKLKYSSSFFV